MIINVYGDGSGRAQLINEWEMRHCTNLLDIER